MSSLSGWTYVSTITVWRHLSSDIYGAPTYDEPFTISGTWEEGGEIAVNNNGQEFRVNSKFYFEMEDDDPLLPKAGDYIAKGDKSATLDPVAVGGQKIQKFGGWDMAMFGDDELPDWVAMT